ncbi:MAG: hypothetical protein ACRC1H_14760 [Caldilineaceae bacterium]
MRQAINPARELIREGSTTAQACQSPWLRDIKRGPLGVLFK